MKPFFGQKRPDDYWWFVKGTEGWTGVVMVALMLVAYTLAQPWFRRNRLRNLPKTLKKLTGFNAFWYSHHLFVVVYILFIIHGHFLYLSKKWDKKTVSAPSNYCITTSVKHIYKWQSPLLFSVSSLFNILIFMNDHCRHGCIWLSQ